MKYTKYDMKAYNLHLLNLDKYKTITIEIDFRRKVKKDEITKRNLLSRILMESNGLYKTGRDLEVETERLYNLNISTTTSISGNYMIFTVTSSFLIDKYTEEGEINKSIDFVINSILNPNIINNEFDSKSFEIVKKSLKENIIQEKENPSLYGYYRMLEEMDKKSPFCFKPIGYLDDLNEITEQNLYEYYKSIIKSDVVDIFLIGNFKDNEIKKKIYENFKINTLKKQPESHFLEHKKMRKKIKTVIEKADFEQSKLYIGLKVENLSSFELKYVMRVYNFILGGGPNSKLFKEVREKNSMCYSINCSYKPVYNLLIISAGINKENFKKCVFLIKKQLKKIESGDFNKDDIDSAITTYISSFSNIEDSPITLLNTYIAHEYLGFDLVDERIKNIQKVNKEMVINISKKIHMDTIYLLEGDKNG